MKKARESLHIVWLHLYDMARIGKLIQVEINGFQVPGAGEIE